SSHDPGGGARQLDDVEAGVRAVGQVHEPTIVHLDVVGLDGDLAAAGAVRRAGRRANLRSHAALGGLRGRSWDVERDLAWRVRIANVDGTDARVEVRDEHHLAIEDRRERLVARVRTEAAAALAELTC